MAAPASDDRPVGFIDSGVGGLTILRAVRRLLPRESTLYAADQAYFPYGDRPEAELRLRTELLSRRLIERDAKLIVVACNAASVGALAHLRATFPATPFVGVVPVIKTLARVTRTGVIGLLCTPSTARSPYIAMLAGQFAADQKLIVVECPGLANQLEFGEFSSPVTQALLHRLLQPLVAAGADAVGLGCTHYPLARRAIKRVLGPGVRVYEPSRPVARRVRQLLAEMSALSTQERPRHDFFTTGRPAQLQAVLDKLRWLAGARAEKL